MTFLSPIVTGIPNLGLSPKFSSLFLTPFLSEGERDILIPSARARMAVWSPGGEGKAGSYKADHRQPICNSLTFGGKVKGGSLREIMEEQTWKSLVYNTNITPDQVARLSSNVFGQY